MTVPNANRPMRVCDPRSFRNVHWRLRSGREARGMNEHLATLTVSNGVIGLSLRAKFWSIVTSAVGPQKLPQA